MNYMTDFWKGYTRSPEMTEKIIDDISDALRAHPDMRLGQLIDNAIGPVIGYSSNLFRVYDETLLKALADFMEAQR